MEKVIITGGSGFIGSHLTGFLRKKNYEVIHLSRSPGIRDGIQSFFWDPEKFEIDESCLPGTDFIIHLAGAGIADKRWTDRRKEELISSRVNGPLLLRNKLTEKNIQPKAFLSSSGINFFGSVTTEKIHTENDPPAGDFISEVVVQWENAVREMEKICRVAMFRFGMVMDKNQGGLPKLAKPVRMGVGAPFGTGKQWLPWIHINDVVRLFYFAMQNTNVKGPYNAVAPEHVNNEQLIRKIAEALGKKIIIPRVPAFVLRIILGELSSVVLEGSRASSQKLLNEGFTFDFPSLDLALKDIYHPD